MTILQPITHTRCSTGQIETDQIKKYTEDVSKYVAECAYSWLGRGHQEEGKP
jgi:hypothetical protein